MVTRQLLLALVLPHRRTSLCVVRARPLPMQPRAQCQCEVTFSWAGTDRTDPSSSSSSDQNLTPLYSPASANMSKSSSTGVGWIGSCGAVVETAWLTAWLTGAGRDVAPFGPACSESPASKGGVPTFRFFFLGSLPSFLFSFWLCPR
ncbi:hypothetical protein BC826DRAFT_609418 [Russula brevipes]|nr:hypothetical protein BC826DRAFT_609418 [Russula brevipes]